jgi:hypothetical protein
MRKPLQINLPTPGEKPPTATQVVAQALIEAHGIEHAMALWPWSRASFYRSIGRVRDAGIGGQHQGENDQEIDLGHVQSQFETTSLDSDLNLRLGLSQFETQVQNCSLVPDVAPETLSQIETHHRHITGIPAEIVDLGPIYGSPDCGDLIRFHVLLVDLGSSESKVALSAASSAFSGSNGEIPRVYALHARDQTFACALLKTYLRVPSSEDFKFSSLSSDDFSRLPRKGVLGGTSQNHNFETQHGKSPLDPPTTCLLQEILPMELPTPPTPSPAGLPECCNNKIIRNSSIVYEGRRISVKPNSAPFVALGGAVVAKYSPETFGQYWSQFWSTFPVRKGKVEAMQAYYQALVAGVDPQVIQAGAEAYAAERRAEDSKPASRRSTPKWPQGWLNGQRWADYDGQTPPQETGVEALRRFTEAMEGSK